MFSNNNKSVYIILLFFTVAVLGYLSYQIIKPFLSSIVWAIVLSIVFYPVYLYLLRFVKWKVLTSIITILIILLLILGPFSYISYILTRELSLLAEKTKAGEFDILNNILNHPLVDRYLDKILSLFHLTADEFEGLVNENIIKMGKNLLDTIKIGVGNIVSAGIDFVFMIFCIYFFLSDGAEYLSKAREYIPFPERYREKLINQIKDIVISTIYGGVTVAFLQGTVGGIAFSLLGVPLPVFWGFAMFLASFIPVVGTLIVWGPAAIYLFVNGFLVKGIILVAVGSLLISSIDNFLRPMIIRGKTKMPIVAIFFSILGGIKLFGFIGFIMGPLVLALFVSVFGMLQFGEQEHPHTAKAVEGDKESDKQEVKS